MIVVPGLQTLSQTLILVAPELNRGSSFGEEELAQTTGGNFTFGGILDIERETEANPR
jgi:hypothetical protein